MTHLRGQLTAVSQPIPLWCDKVSQGNVDLLLDRWRSWRGFCFQWKHWDVHVHAFLRVLWLCCIWEWYFYMEKL